MGLFGANGILLSDAKMMIYIYGKQPDMIQIGWDTTYFQQFNTISNYLSDEKWECKEIKIHEKQNKNRKNN